MSTTTSDGHTKRKRKSADQRRGDILAAAGGIFAEHGFHHADMQLIADCAGVGKGTVYRFFATKDDLFRATIDDAVCRLTAQVDSAIEGIDDSYQVLRTCFKSYMAYFQQYPEVVDLFIHEQAELRGKSKPLYFVYSDARRNNWQAICQNLIDSGRCRINDSQLMLDAISNLAYGSVLVNRISGRNACLDEMADGLLDLLFKGILEAP
ncbi:MAG TPA: TetR/AcrR family transcriptional regulator [Pseudomonas xinjiangensis]|uniref:TetR/AcrR family transcriptional regulator n=2 Tax=root TaxID=1 RepID=A0A7V1BR61_9GAMM|nr:TetR/AcrR family transcriptional regulator [Halopseudomonas xinjiangensis]HEC49356.1 TetR/AcrR family transcriptional regulator [Halopseudomonas xinjiangensis]